MVLERMDAVPIDSRHDRTLMNVPIKKVTAITKKNSSSWEEYEEPWFK
jgi:hypothetical protein